MSCYSMTDFRSTAIAAGVAAAVLAMGTPDVAAAQQTDSRWLPFSGCWEPVGEAVSSEAPATRICFGGVDGGPGVEMVSLEDGEVVAREALEADGTWRDAAADGCTGREFGDFSATPGRVYLRAEHVCEGGVSRSSTGMMTFVSPRQWIEVRVVTSGDESFAWFTRYRMAPPIDAAGVDDIAADRDMAVNAARVAASGRPTIDDVIEASEYVDDEALKTWLAERDTWLESLESDDLLRLADAGVSEDVIDMAIAVSYPERFLVEREVAREYGGLASYDPFYDPFYGRYYSPYRYGYGYGYGFGYGYGGGYGGPIIVTVRPDDKGNSGGRVIAGQGYTRGQTPGASRGTPTRSRGGTVGSTGRSSGSSIGRSSGGSTGRTARRRGGGS